MNILNHLKWISAKIRIFKQNNTVLSLYSGDMEYSTNSTDLLSRSTRDKPDQEMLDEEDNMYPNPDNVILYQHYIRNRTEQGSIGIS